MSYTDGITPDWFENRSIGGIYGDMKRIKTPEEAKIYFDNYVLWLDRHQEGHPNETSTEVAISNLGWCFGEGMSAEERQMWHEATGATHPVFGTKIPTPEEAFRMGQEIGAKYKDKP